MKSILVTGGGGFIGHHFLKYTLDNTDWTIFALYRENFERIPKSNRVTLLKEDLSKNEISYPLPQLDYIVHMAGETYVDNSLKNCIPFVTSNVLGTANLLEWIKKNQPQAKTCIFSSDEVLGPAPEGVYFTEKDIPKPSNPYSATKAAEEFLAYAFAHSFNLPIFTIRCMNVLGEGESPQKFIPKVVNSIKNGEKIILHGTNKDNVASRHWIYAKDVADAVLFLLDKATPPETYHISGEEMDVHNIAEIIYSEMKDKTLSEEEIEYIDFHNARPGHDKRYSLSMEKLNKMGWRPTYGLEECIRRSVREMINKKNEQK